jgi:sigma-B regulation protein RsbU (phosphoserine phosphatase)
MNLLVVDDEPSYRMLISDYFRQQGWTVFEAGEGDEALKQLAIEKIDFIISDIYMPVMDGLKFHKAVREHPIYGQLPFLFVSAYDDQYTIGAVKDTKLDGFIRKGRSLPELKAWVAYLMTPLAERPKLPPTSYTSPVSGHTSARLRDDSSHHHRK